MKPDVLRPLCNARLIPKFLKHCSNPALIAWLTSAIEGSEELILPDAWGVENPPIFLQDTSSNEISCEDVICLPFL